MCFYVCVWSKVQLGACPPPPHRCQLELCQVPQHIAALSRRLNLICIQPAVATGLSQLALQGLHAGRKGGRGAATTMSACHVSMSKGARMGTYGAIGDDYGCYAHGQA